jgi:hypothetical protein
LKKMLEKPSGSEARSEGMSITIFLTYSCLKGSSSSLAWIFGKEGRSTESKFSLEGAGQKTPAK